MKRFNRLFLTLLLLAIAQKAQAFPAYKTGPFFSKAQLVAYWTAEGHTLAPAAVVSLNAYVVYEQSGFGPASNIRYFQCSDRLIRTSCDSIADPFTIMAYATASVDDLIGAPESGHTSIYLDGALARSAFSPPFGTFWFKTCLGDTSPYVYGRLSYVILDKATTGWGPISGSACLPRL